MATITLNLDPKGATFGSSNVPTIVNIIGASGGPLFAYGAPQSVRTNIYFSRLMTVFGASNVNMLVTVMWRSQNGVTTGNIVLGARLYALTAGDATSDEAKSYAAAATVVSPVNGTAKGPQSATITVTGLDSMTAGDYMSLNVYRDGTSGSDNLADIALFMGCSISFSDT